MNVLGAIVLGVIVSVAIFLVLTTIGKFQQAKFTSVKIGNATVNAEIADTISKQTRGLMFRENLGTNDGMLFVFSSESKHGIWMANMSFPIDIIWLDSKKKVVHVVESAPPCEALAICKIYSPDENAKYVLEVNAGFAKKHGIAVGKNASFNVSNL